MYINEASNHLHGTMFCVYQAWQFWWQRKQDTESEKIPERNDTNHVGYENYQSIGIKSMTGVPKTA